MNVRLSSLSHTYTQRKGHSLLALREIDLEIRGGEFVALIGPSGCGKSTLLRILAGLLIPEQGLVSLGDMPLQASIVRKQVAWMAQRPALLPWRTVSANVSLAQQINAQNGRPQLSLEELLELVQLEDFAHAYPFTLSGGMQQRAALARTLALGAATWLMDEPFTALDELTRESLTEEVLHLWQRFRPTVLWVTHSIQEAVRVADRVLVMTPRPGHIRATHVIPLSRPRDDTSAPFQDLVRAIRLDLASKS
jgi:NitT/TauT family transport system ATP-binding protein